MSIHKPVLLKETIELLNLKKGAVVVDATLGSGGHSRAILEKIGGSGKLVAVDLDKRAIDNFAKANDKRVILINDNFANLENILRELKINKVDAILADLGWSSDQLSGKGMSFLADEPLDMRLGDTNLTAKKIVNEYSREDLEKIVREYGEEKFYKRIAKGITEAREKKTIGTTRELAEIIKNSVPKQYQRGRINPATRTFQAIRIEVNNELENLEKFIPQAMKALNPHGRLAVIAFHSLEDRIVKNIFRENARGCICPQSFPQCVCGKTPKIKRITKKPATPAKQEIENNSRSRSAKLRAIEKL